MAASIDAVIIILSVTDIRVCIAVDGIIDRDTF